MSNNMRRIFVSIFTLVLTVVAVGTTTFAWFSIGNIATVTGITGQVVGGEGLEIQMTVGDGLPTDWLNHIGEEEFNAKKPADFKFKAVDRNYKQLEVITSDTNIGKLKEGGATTPNKDYLELTFKFRSLSAGSVRVSNVTFEQVMTNSFNAGVAYEGVNGETIEANEPTPSFDAGFALRLTLEDLAEDSQVEDITYRKVHTVEIDDGQWSYLMEKRNEVYASDGTTKVEPSELEGSHRQPTGVAFNGDSDEGNAFTVELVKEKVVDPENPGDLIDGQYWIASIKVTVWVDGWDPHTFDVIYQELLEFAITFTKDNE